MASHNCKQQPVSPTKSHGKAVTFGILQYQAKPINVINEING